MQPSSETESPSPPTFLCDEMLQRLGSWLRAAGYDTTIARNGEDDYQLLRQAIAEGRLLVTMDRELARHRRAKSTVVLLEADSLEACAEALSQQVPIDWLSAPFTRCMACNTDLIDASPQQVRSLPLKTKDHIDAAFYCPECRQVFWEGSHVKRMRRHLQDWSDKYSHGQKVKRRRQSSY
ncbi:MAG: Mut7-C RNAse domain-containing protein [Gammaproteobacteria bacterium]|nr:Mut7-C RNAse domain-containing protein [Gammaproteobacteria bacterium]